MFAGIDLDRVIPTIERLPVIGEKFTTPGGVLMVVETLLSMEPGRIVAVGPMVDDGTQRVSSARWCCMFWCFD